MSENTTDIRQKTITLTKLEDTSHYRLWRAATEATFDVYNVLNIVLGTEDKPDNTSDNFNDWERRHKLAREALITALKPAQQIRIIHLKSAHEIWQRLIDEYGKISELKRAQLNAKLRSLRKSPQTKIRNHIDEFESIQHEIEFHSEPMTQADVNIAFLISLGDSETWKNYRNSNLHRAATMKTAELQAEVTLIDDSTPSSYNDSYDQARALLTSFNGGGYQGGHHRGSYRGSYRGRGNGRGGASSGRGNKPPFNPDKVCEGCKKQGHEKDDCLVRCNYCKEQYHVIDDCLKLQWNNTQRVSKPENGHGREGDKEYRPSFERPSFSYGK